MKHSNLYIYMYRYREQLGEGGYNIGKKTKTLEQNPNTQFCAQLHIHHI